MTTGKKIIIVGGGTAAWISAFMFKSLGNCNDISVIEPEINQPIGVGESTTPHFWFFLNRWCPYFDEKDFLKKTGSTLKFGVIHENWMGDGKSFSNPIDSSGRLNKEHFPLDFDYIRSHCVESQIHPAIGYESLLMNQNLVPFERSGNSFLQKGNYAYHLNVDCAIAYFKIVGQREGIKSIKGTVREISGDEKINHLILSDERKIHGDLFVDCTGQNRILSNLFGQKFVQYKELPLDSAVIFKKPHGEEIPNFTRAIATEDGWQWEIPVKDEMHCGYIFNSKITDTDTIKEKFQSEKLVKFNSGRVEKFLNRNILSIGLSSGFVEPLEATSLHASLVQLNIFLSEFYRPDFSYENKLLEERYNNRMANFWDSIRDWIRMHYFTTRKDSIFWECVQLLDTSLKLEEKMEIFKTRMPRESDCNPGEIYQNSLTFHVLSGMGILNPNIARKELDFYGLSNIAKNDLDRITQKDQNFIRNFVKHKYYLDNI
jgi:tryptophan halogenase